MLPERSTSKLPLRLAVAFIAVGLLRLTVHYWAGFALLAVLPTKQWREAYLTPGRPAPQQPLRDMPPQSTRCAAGLSGRPGHSSPSSRLRQNAATVG